MNEQQNNLSDSISVCFYGSSDEGLEDQLATEHKALIQKVVREILQLPFKSFRIITGGYGGVMDLIASEFKDQRKGKKKRIQIVGITCEAYHCETPTKLEKIEHKKNEFSYGNDLIIHAESFPARIQAMVESSDIFIVLPGKHGTLGEFLTTYDSLRYPINRFKNSNKKILIYEDHWKNLISDNKYFRSFNETIISFFNKDNFASQIKNLNSVPLSYFKPNFKKKKHRQVNIEEKFKEYYKNLIRVLYGSLKGLKTNFKFVNNLLSLDFGYIFSDKTTEVDDDGMFLTYSTSKYMELMREFFEEHNSIMLAKGITSDFQVEFMPGSLQTQTSIKYLKNEKVPSFSRTKAKSTFKTWANFLKGKDYGQTLIWRGITQKGQDENSYKLNLSIFLLFNSQLPSRKIEKIRQLTDEFLVDVSTYKIAQLFGKKEKELKSQAVRAAVSQVMARNMSHNIGSHVMNKLLNVTDIEAVSKFNYYQSPISAPNEIIKALMIFNAYLKARMDYLADVTFGTPVMQTNKKFYGEVFKGFDQNRLLLNNISALAENFIYEVVFKYNGNELNDNNDLKIALPNDLLGCQAFYNVLENIIRNTAKHSRSENKPPVIKFTVNICDCKETPSLYKVEVFDNILPGSTATEDEKINRLKEYNADQLVTIKKDELSEIDWIVFKQNSTLNESVLDKKTNQLRTTALGMIEIEASAAYLRKIDIIDIEADKYIVEHDESPKNKHGKFNILKAFNNEGSLGYQFFVLKPTEILLVGNYSEINDERRKELLKEGIWILGENDFKESLQVFNHQFLLYDNSELSEIIKHRATSLPTRVIKIQKELKEKINTILTNSKNILAEFEELIWREWSEKLLSARQINNINVQTSIADDEKKEKWFQAIFLKHAEAWNKNEDNFKVYDEVLSEGIFHEGKISYLEALPSNSEKKLPGFTTNLDNLLDNIVKTDTQNSINRFKLNESIISKIVVIDERVQDAAIYNKYSYKTIKIPFSKLYQYTNIILPVSNEGKAEKTIDLRAKEYDLKIKEAIKTYINDSIENGCDFLLLHYSILERMFNSEKDSINNYLAEISSKTKVVITSGRGRHSCELPDSVRYINLTSVLDVFVESRSKYEINYLLNSSRK